MATKIFFIVLESDNKNRLLCDLTDKIYTENHRMVFYINDQILAKDFDQKLWMWKQSSFIPHLYTPKLETPFEEPVIITSEIETAADYNILLMYDPAPLEVLSKFTQVIDFAEKYDLTALQKSRERYQMYQEKKWPVDTVKPGEFLLLNL